MHPENLFGQALPPDGEESEQQLQKGTAGRSRSFVLNRFKSPEGSWLDQDDHEWVMVLRGAPGFAALNPIGSSISVLVTISIFRRINVIVWRERIRSRNSLARSALERFRTAGIARLTSQ